MRALLALAGLLGGLFWIVLALFPPIGVRETREYEVFFNRLWTPTLLAMLFGCIALFLARRPVCTRFATGGLVILLAGLALMVVGNFTEYWLLNDLPHQGPEGYKRGIAWMAFLLGFLATQLALASLGLHWLMVGGDPKWLSLLFVGVLPATIAIGLVSMNWSGAPLGIASIAIGWVTLHPWQLVRMLSRTQR